MTLAGAVNIAEAPTTSRTLILSGAGNTTISGIIANAAGATTAVGSLTYSGTGTLTLTNTENYKGATTISSGTVALGSGGNLAATAVTVASGATLAVTPGVLSATNAIATGGALTLSTGSAFTMLDGTTSTFTVNGAGALGASTMMFELGGTTTATDRLTITGAATITNAGEKINITAIGSTALTGGPFTLISGGAGSTLATNPYTLGNSRVTVGTTAYGLSLTSSAGSVVLNITGSGAASAYWTGNQGNNWNATSGSNTNWATTLAGTTDLGAQPGALQDVYFAATGATNLTTNVVNAPYTINSLNFLSTTGAVTIGAGSAITLNAGSSGNIGISDASSGAVTINTPLTLGAAQTWTNSSVSALTINGAVTNGGFGLTTAGTGSIVIGNAISGAGALTVTGAGGTTLSGNNTYTGGTTVSNSTLILIGGTGSTQAGTLSTTGNVTVASGGTLQLQATSANTTSGVSYALSNSTGAGGNGGGQLNLANGSTLQLRSDTAVSFAGTNKIGSLNNATVGINVDQLTSAGVGNAFTLASGGSIYANTVALNITGGHSNTLVLGALTNIGVAGSNITLNPTTTTVQLLGYTSTNNAGNTLVLGGSTTGNTVTGNITVGSGGVAVTSSGTGTWTLSGANTYVGTTTLSSGTLIFAGAGTLPGSSAISVTGASAFTVLNNGAGNNGTIAQGNTLTLNSNVTETLNVGNNGSNTGNTIAFGALSNPQNTGLANLAVNGSNGYNVSFTSFALPGSNGQSSQLTPTNASITIIGNVTNTIGSTATKFDTLFLDGTSTGNLISGVISNQASSTVGNGDTRVTKQNTSTWTLSGANTYVGPTAVNGGTLVLASNNNSGSLGLTAVTVSGATLQILNTGTTPNYTIGATSGAITTGGLTIGGVAAATAANLTFSNAETATSALTVNNPTATNTALTFGSTTANTTTATLTFNTGNSSVDSITTNAKALVNLGGAVVNLTALSGTTLANGTYTLLTTAAAGLTQTGTFTLGSYSAPAGTVDYLTTTGNTLVLNVGAAGTGAGATTVYWSGSISTVWNAGLGTTTTNFVNALTGGTQVAVPDAGTNVIFTSNGAINVGTTLGQGFNINSLTFNSLSTGVSIGGSLPLTIMATNSAGNTSGNGITMQSGQSAVTISAPVILGGTQTWTNNSANGLIVSGNVSGGFGLTVNATAAGAFTLSGSNTFTGGLTLTAGTLLINSATALGTGTFTINGGTIDNTTAGALVLTTNNLQNWNADFTYTASVHSLTMGNGAVTINATRTITVGQFNFGEPGVIGDGGSGFGITKNGAGTLTLSGLNTFSGAVTVNSGILNFNTVFNVSGGASALGVLPRSPPALLTWETHRLQAT